MYNISTAVHSQYFSPSLYSDSSKVVAKPASATSDNLVAGGASDPLHLQPAILLPPPFVGTSDRCPAVQSAIIHTWTDI
jgi:hypothetical protein